MYVVKTPFTILNEYVATFGSETELQVSLVTTLLKEETPLKIPLNVRRDPSYPLLLITSFKVDLPDVCSLGVHSELENGYPFAKITFWPRSGKVSEKLRFLLSN